MRRVLISAVALSALAVSACGNDVPTNGVAKIGDSVITKEQFSHWLKAAASGTVAPGQQAVVPDPPTFTKCIAQQRKAPAPEGGKKPTDAQLKTQCKQQYDSLKQQVMQFLISAEWIQQEAKERDIEVKDAEVKKQFEDQKKQSFPKEADYKKFLESSGMTEADLLFRVRLDLLSNEVRQEVIKGKGKVTDAQITKYYNENKKRFAQPERRDLLVVLTRNKSKAEQAKAALEDGDSWKAVSKKFSIDEASKAQGGKLPGVAKGQQEKALDEAIFKARRGELTGPVKTQFGYYVFEVQKVTPASQQSLAQTKETIRNLLKSQNEQKALDAFVKEFREDYKDKTNCAKDYVVQDCKNAPKPKQTGPASGAPPVTGGQQPQPTPQPGQPAPQQAPPPQQAPQE